MKEGTIKKMFSYYFENPRLEEEVFRAHKKFFNKPNLKLSDKLDVGEDDWVMFNEWFIFDFRLSNGKTPLEDFYYTNPYNLKPVQLQVYKDLQENHFGLYEVLGVRRGEGLRLKNLQTDKIYEVREYSATFDLKEGQVFSSRVGKVGDHYELVGGNVSFGPVKIKGHLKKIFKESKEELNPKILRDSFLGDRPAMNPLAQYPSLREAEENLKKVLEKYGLDKFVDTKIIKTWIYNHTRDDSPPYEFNMLCGLLYPNMKDYNKALTKLLDRFNIFYNLCPQRELGGKSPFDRRKENEQKGEPPDLVMSSRKFPPSGWGKKYNKVLKYMKQGKFKQALKKFNEVFSYLLENKTTYPEIYRLYANKGVCHFGLDEPVTGEFMLKISAELNPFYDFAKQLLEKIKKDDFVRRKKRRKTKEEQDITRDIGYQYYQFLKPFKINFAHASRTSIMNIKREN